MSKKETRVLFVGTGGGNDLFSTLFAAALLRRMPGRETWDHADIAGVISPFHRHTVDPTDTPGLLRTRPDSKRFLIRRGDEREIPFIDAKVAQLVESKQPYHIENVYALSLEEGSRGLTETFSLLTERYDEIVLVDIGGDILYDGTAPRVLSPMFDSIVLRAFVDSDCPGVLFEAGPGTDGEMHPEALMAALAKSGAHENAFAIKPNQVVWWKALYEEWIAGTRPGNTVPVTIRALQSESNEEFKVEYSARGHIGDVKKYAKFEQRIDPKLCRAFYLIDPARIANPFAVECVDPLDWFMKTQIQQRRTNCEMNLEYLQTGPDIEQMLTPSPMLAIDDRNELVLAGLKDLTAGVTDWAHLFRDDWVRVPGDLKTRYYADTEGPLVTVCAKRR